MLCILNNFINLLEKEIQNADNTPQKTMVFLEIVKENYSEFDFIYQKMNGLF